MQTDNESTWDSAIGTVQPVVRTQSRIRATAWVSAALTLVIATVVSAYGVYVWTENVYVFDDSYISYRYADNLATGHGLVYNVGERVQGYTNFLWTMIASAAIRCGLDPLKATQTLGVIAHGLMLALIAAFATWSWLRRGAWALALLPLISVLVLPEGFAAMAGSGLESPLVALLLVLAGVQLWLGDPARWSTRVGLALVLSLATLTRLDCAVAAGAAGAAIVIARWVESGPQRSAWMSAFAVVAPVAVTAATFLIWTYAYYGDVLPNTYYAKAANVSHLREGAAYVKAFAQSYSQSMPLLLLTVAGMFLPGNERLRRLSIYVSLTIVADLLHIVRVGGDFMEYRFMWQLYGLLTLGAFAGLALLARSARVAAVIVAAATLTVSFQAPQLETKFNMQSLVDMNNYMKTGREVGIRLGQVLPKQTILAASLAGTTAYYSKLTVIDQWGLTDRATAHTRFTGKWLSRGHVKRPSESYLRARHVNLYIDHPAICSCAHPCREDKPNVFIRLDNGRCLRTWYFGEDPELTRHFCSRPDVFVLNRVDCDHSAKVRRQSSKRKSPPVDSR